MKNEDWDFDSQATYFCPFCGAEAYEFTPSKHVCFKCKRIFSRPEFLGNIEEEVLIFKLEHVRGGAI